MSVLILRAAPAGTEVVPARLQATMPGGFAADGYLAGGFVVQFITFLAASGLLVFSCRKVRPTGFNRSLQGQFFGLRISLAFYAVASLLAWLFMAFANVNGAGFSEKYIVFSIFPLIFLFAAETTLLHALLRLAWQPLVHVACYKRARSVALGLATFFGLTSVTLWSAYTALVATNLRDVETQPSDTVWNREIRSASSALAIATLIYWCTAALWGLVAMGAAIDALRQSKGALKETYRIVPKLIIPASIMWFARFVLFFLFDIYGHYGIRFLIPTLEEDYNSYRPVMQPMLTNGLLFIVYILCFLCFRTNLLPFYSASFGIEDPAAGPSYDLGGTAPGTELPGHDARAEPGVQNLGPYGSPARNAARAEESDGERHPSSFV